MALHAPIFTPVHFNDLSTCAATSEQPPAYRFWKLQPVQKLQLSLLKKLDADRPASPDQSPSPDPPSLSDYIESHRDKVLQYDKHRRQIGWEATSDSLLDDYYADVIDDRPYEPPHPQSHNHTVSSLDQPMQPPAMPISLMYTSQYRLGLTRDSFVFVQAWQMKV